MTRPTTFNLADLLTLTVNTVPADREALICGDKRLTYRQFLERVRRLASWLHGHGIGAGDAVGIHSYNRIEFMEATFATYLLKAVPVNVNFRYTPDEARYIYRDAQLKGLIYGKEVEPCVAEARDAAPDLRVLVRIGEGPAGIDSAVAYESTMAADDPAIDDIPRSEDDLLLLYTGGTTGRPKGVMWTHKALFYAAFDGGGSFNRSGPIQAPAQMADRVKENHYLRQLPCGPLMHGAGMWGTTIGLLAGITVCLNERPDFNAPYILDTVVREKINIISLIGDTMAMALIEALKAEPKRWDLSQVMVISNGGALLSEHAKQALKAFLQPHAVIVDSMGSSETGASGVGGKPGDGGLIRIAASPTVTVVVDRNRFAEPGEMGILARMGHLPLGYHGDPQKTAETFVHIDGKRCAISGDSARLEEDGSITVFGRDSQCINTGGEKVFTEEVEEALRSYESVTDALVVGVPDPRWGQKVVAVVSLRAGAPEDADALKQHCRQKLAGYKVPKNVVFVQGVPRSPVGKADYRWAKSLAEKELNPA